MNAYILIIVLLTSNGPAEHRFDFYGRGRLCEAAARDFRLGALKPPEGTVLLTARCVREYDT